MGELLLVSRDAYFASLLNVSALRGNEVLMQACPLGFCHEHALILYVYLTNDEDGGDESVLTVGLTSSLFPLNITFVRFPC